MVGTAQHTSERNISSGLLWLRPLLLALLGALLFAASARADVPVAELPPPPPVLEKGPETPPPVPVEPPVETPPAPVPPPAPVEPPVETPPPAPVTEVAPETPPPIEGAPTTPSTPAATPSTPVEPPAETAARSLLPAPAAPGGEAPSQVTDGLIASQPGGTAGGNPGEVALISAAARASIGARAGMIAAQRAGGLSCQLSALVGDSCPSGSFAAQRLVAAPIAGSGGPPLGGATAARGPSDGDGGAAVGSRAPANPASGSAPGGASGGAAGGGGSGLGLSAFLTLAGLLLLAPLLAMRRLRLSCQPLLTACFVLIPERPG